MNPSDPSASPPVYSGGSSPLPAPAGNGNVLLGLVGGLVGAFLGAALWAAIAYFTNYKLGLIAIVVGLAAGFGVRLLGKGRTALFSVVGAVCALLGCVVGDCLTIIALGSKVANVSLLDMMQRLPFSALVDILKEAFDVKDILFYGIAAYEGWRFAVNQE